MSLLRPFRLASVLYEVTARCNLACAHCYNVWKDGVAYPMAELDTDQAEALIAKAIRESRCEQFTFTGGEPCLREDLERLVAFAKARVRHTVLISNGTLLDAVRIDRLVRAGVDLVELPLHAGDPETHDAVLGCPGSFDHITRAATALREAGAQVAFVFVGRRSNMDRWPAALELGVALGARSFLLNRWNAGGSAHARPEALLPTPAQVTEALAAAEAGVRRYGVAISASIPLPPCLVDTAAFPSVGFGFCSAGSDRAYFTLDPLGRVRPCNHSPTILGDLRTQSFRRIARSPAMRRFREARPAFCGGCPKARDCQGGCKAAAEACYGDLHACEPFLALHAGQARRPEA